MWLEISQKWKEKQNENFLKAKDSSGSVNSAKKFVVRGETIL